MQWNIYVNQKLFCQHHKDLDIKDAVLFDYLKNFYPHAKKKGVYAYISYRYVIENLPLLGIKSREVIGRRMKKLKCSGLIDFRYDLGEARVYYLMLNAPNNPNMAKDRGSEAEEVIDAEDVTEGLNEMDEGVESAELIIDTVDKALEEAALKNLKNYVAEVNAKRGFIDVKDAGWAKIQGFYEKSQRGDKTATDPVDVLEAVLQDEFWGSKVLLSKHYHHYQGVYYKSLKKSRLAKEKRKRPLLFNTDELLFGRIRETKEEEEENYEL